MRSLIVLLLIPIVFGQSPISDVLENNSIAAESLDNYYNASLAENSSFIVTFENRTDKNISVSSYLDIAGMNLLLDNMTYPTEGLSVILARGYRQGHLMAMPLEGYPDFICTYDNVYGQGGLGARCDHDDDYCFEYENRTWVIYDMDVNFTFRNVSESVPLTSNAIPVPEDVLEEMKTSSGSEYLNISIEGDVIFLYEFNDQYYVMDDCGNRGLNASAAVSHSINKSFLVAGQQKLFFLRSPVLREQWFRSNRFNTIVLSQSPLYLANISLNGNQSVLNHTLREFNVTTNNFSLQEIVSNLTNATGWSESRNLTTPYPLEPENHSFSFIYEFNYSYQGLGKNNLSILVVDSFLGEAEYSEILLSRMLSYNGSKTETGVPFNESTARKSGSFEKGELSYFEISLGFLALLVILLFLNFWIKR